MNFKYLFLLFSILPLVSMAQNQKPLVSIFELFINEQNQEINISYDVNDVDNNFVDVSVLFSSNGGQDFQLIENATGDVGEDVVVSNGLRLVWNYTDELDGDGEYIFKVVADDKESYQIEDMLAQVDEAKLKEDMLKIVGVRNRVEPDHINEVKALFEQEINDNNLELETQSWMVGNYEATNFIGTQKGLIHEDEIYINDGHYDTVPGSPGADDNGSAVVGVLAGLKILSQFDFEKTIKYIFFDMEEDGLVGSINYVSNIAVPRSYDIKGVFNYEMIGFFSDEEGTQSLPAGFEILFPDAYQAVIDGGSRGNFITNVANVNSGPLKNVFDQMAATYVPELRVISLEAPGNAEFAPDLRRSDHTPFWEAAYQALMLTDGANFRNINYHEETDTEETIDYPFLSNVVKATIASIATLAVPIHAGSDEMALTITTSQKDILNSENVLIYPSLINESTNSIKIDINAIDEAFRTISLYDIKGNLISTNDIPNNAFFEYEIPNLDNGLYLIQLSNEKASLSKYLIKQ